MSLFSDRCYNLLKKVPRGKVTTYKILANTMSTKAYRAVGNVLNKNPPKDVPCHRVIKSTGEIGGFASGTSNKIKLLRKENIIIINHRINLEKYWHKF